MSLASCTYQATRCNDDLCNLISVLLLVYKHMIYHFDDQETDNKYCIAIAYSLLRVFVFGYFAEHHSYQN